MTDIANRKTKVLHLISGDLWAGAEVMALNLLIALKEFPDLDIHVILLNEGRLAEELRKSGLTVYVIDERLYSFWEIFQRTLSVITDKTPDIIHAHRYKENILAFLISQIFRRLKLIATQHGLPEISNNNPNFTAHLKSKANFHILSRFFYKTVAVSADIQKTLINLYGFSHNKVPVIHNGIHLPPTIPCSNKGDVYPFTIGSSGRLFPVKNYSLMVEIARVVKLSGNTNIRFELAGDGPEWSALECLIERYELQNQFFLRGHLDDMDSFYSGLDLYLNTSIHEGIPMTILEALGQGLPIIAPAVGGIVEIFTNGEEGYLIDSRDPQDFAEKCLQLYDDDYLRDRMSQAARVRAEEGFSAVKMAESYYQIYIQI